MKPAIAERLAQALESGKYRQGNGYLRQGNAFCCLGVLCNLHAQAHPKIAAAQPGESYMDQIAYVPWEVMKWAGMKSHDGSYPGSTLARDNDGGHDFKQIAKIVRKNQADL